MLNLHLRHYCCARWPDWAPPVRADPRGTARLLLFVRTAAALTPALPGLRVAAADVADARAAEALFLRALAAAQEVGEEGEGEAGQHGAADGAAAALAEEGASERKQHDRCVQKPRLRVLLALHGVLAGVWRDGHALDAHAQLGIVELAPAGAAEPATRDEEGDPGTAQTGVAAAAAECRPEPGEGWEVDEELELNLGGAADAGTLTGPPAEGHGAGLEGWGTDGELDLGGGSALATAPTAPAAEGEGAAHEGWEAEQELEQDLAAGAAGGGAPTAPQGGAAQAAREGWEADEELDLDLGGQPLTNTPAVDGWGADEELQPDLAAAANARASVAPPAEGWDGADEEVAMLLRGSPVSGTALRAPASPPAAAGSAAAGADHVPASSISSLDLQTAAAGDVANSQADAVLSPSPDPTPDPKFDPSSASAALADGCKAAVPLHACWEALLQAMLRAGGGGSKGGPEVRAGSGAEAALREADAARAAGRPLVTAAEACALVAAAQSCGAEPEGVRRVGAPGSASSSSSCIQIEKPCDGHAVGVLPNDARSLREVAPVCDAGVQCWHAAHVQHCSSC